MVSTWSPTSRRASAAPGRGPSRPRCCWAGAPGGRPPPPAGPAIPLDGLEGEGTGTYDGPRCRAFEIAGRADAPTGEEMGRLVEAAQRVCYVTRTLAEPPEITYTVG